MISRIRPVGEPVPVPEPGQAPPWPEEWGCSFVQSGTAALALALSAVLGQRRDGERRVLVPAYGCPDIVSAVVFAGGRPVLVDTAPSSPFMDMARLGEALSAGAAAVVAAHFLGIRQDLSEASRLCREAGAVLVEDSAQRIPAWNQDDPQADLVILSFGRGKPATGLGGGALLHRGHWREPVEHAGRKSTAPTAEAAPTWKTAARRTLFNVMLRPFPYGLASRLPLLGIGETRYRPLAEIRMLEDDRRAVALAALFRWDSKAPATQRVMEESLARDVTGWISLSGAFGQTERRLLRLPVLAPSESARDAALARLADLGASFFYGRPLADVPAMPPLDAQAPAQARVFASQLLTLPVHSGVTATVAQRLIAELSSCPSPDGDANPEPFQASRNRPGMGIK